MSNYTGKYEFLCKIKGGSIFALYQEAYSKLLKHLDDQEVVIIIKKIGKRRTDKFNAFYWAAIVQPITIAIKEMTGETYSREEVHAMLKQKFLSKSVINSMTGEVLEIPRSTSSLSQDEFKEYVEFCKRFANDFFDIKIA
jgi:hypothetical protein